MARAATVAWLKTHVGSRAEARRLAKGALSKRLAACANLEAIESFYWWKGRIENTAEVSVVFKTDRRRLPKLREWVEEAHPYDVPYIAWGKAEPVPGPYARWVISSAAARRTRRPRAPRGRAAARTR